MSRPIVRTCLSMLALAVALLVPQRMLHAQARPDQTAAAPQPTPPSTPVAQPRPDGRPHTFTAAKGEFLLDGKPFRLISGEMHYPRIPREYWRARLRMARAMGLNAITTYVFWNVHEPTPGTYDFSGQNDVAEFIREAQQEGLWVILRPGPYVCAEWEFGGYPAWLLKTDPSTPANAAAYPGPYAHVRSMDPRYMVPATRWLTRLGKELAPLQDTNGGPILLVQVENEYGSFGSDHAYMEANRKALLAAGFTGAQLYTADGPADVPNGSLPELPVGINFDGNRPNQAEKSFAALARLRPDGPRFNSEFWAGWFDHWGGPHAHTNAQIQADNLAWELAHGDSVSIYMFEGGTDFGWRNGANSSDAKKDYQPDVTSYDYDAALDESGRPTPKYFLFRNVIAKATGITPPPVPAVPAPIAIPPIHLTEAASLWANLPKPIESPTPLTMEDIGQNYGYILYRTHLSGSSGSLTVHDYARTYLDGEDDPSSTADRRLHGNVAFETHVDRTDDGTSQLDILVENMGRINYSHQLLHDRKGITAWTPPAAGPHAPKSWSIYPLPFTGVTDPSRFQYAPRPCSGPCFYRASFDLPAGTAPADTFLDTSALGEGQLWINGHAMGRFWSIGPQKTLYVPGPWLKPTGNELILFDLNGKPGLTVQGLTKPNLGQTTGSTDTGNP